MAYTTTPAPDAAEALNALQRAAAKLPLNNRFSNQELEILYSQGYQLFQQEHLEKAMRYFATLLIYRPLEPKYLKALAICYHKLGMLREALQTYAFAIIFRPEDFSILLSMAECHLGLNETADALNILQTISGIDDAPPQQQPFIDRAKLLLEARKGS